MKSEGNLMGRFAAIAASMMLGMGCSSSPAPTTGSAAPEELNSTPVPAELAKVPPVKSKALCGDSVAPGFARCHAQIRLDAAGQIARFAMPTGIGPVELRDAYKIPTSGGNGTLVAIVDANDDPNAEADLAVYRANYGLPPCTTDNGCFQKVNQNGGAGPYPTPDQGWAGEISLDVDMVSAVCPDCRILLVEANTPSIDDLGAAVNRAVAMGAKVISNSYGGPEDSSIPAADELYFHHDGVTVTVSAGDTGTGVEYPATSQYVTAIGGTALTRSATAPRGWVETTWGSGFWTRFLGGTGSGCSGVVAKPAWQKDTGCAKRVEADVSAVASPSTGPAVYDSYGSEGSGWMVVGGTSAASPIVAGIYAITGHAGENGSFSYAHPEAFYDVTSGSNGSCKGYICNAIVGYDGPTGNGTPNAAALLALPATKP